MHEEQEFSAQFDAIFAVGTNFLHQGKYDEALVIFEGLIALVPSEHKAAIAYGEALLLANRAEKALNHFFSLSKQFEMDGHTLLLTAKACILLEKTEEAKKLLCMVSAHEVNVSREDLRTATTMLSLLNAV